MASHRLPPDKSIYTKKMAPTKFHQCEREVRIRQAVHGGTNHDQNPGKSLVLLRSARRRDRRNPPQPTGLSEKVKAVGVLEIGESFCL